jgi:hypothetical protein
VKFTTKGGGIAIAGAIVYAVVHVGLKVSMESLQQHWAPTLLSVGLLVLALALFVLVHFLRQRHAGRETIEIGRRGLLVTQPETAPIAVAWRAIRSADLEQKDRWQWRLTLKTGGEVLLREEAFAREHWKKLSAELQRKLQAKKIPVRVIGAGQSQS